MLKTQLQQATTLLSSAYKSIVSCEKGQRTIQTHPLPLALCKPDGTMRAGCKSDFKDVMLELFPNSNTFTTSNILTHDYEVIVDFFVSTTSASSRCTDILHSGMLIVCQEPKM